MPGERSGIHPALLFSAIFAVVFVLHGSLLQLPYFWDEAGYYIPAARDILLHGSLIPQSTVSNAHPPLVMAWLALWWRLFGNTPVVTRSAMLVIAAFALTGVFRIAERTANTQVAIASTLCTALYPVFFAQSSLAHVDLAAAAFTFWGVAAYLENRPAWVATWFCCAVMAKETAILAPAALAVWVIVSLLFRNRLGGQHLSSRCNLALLVPMLPLTAWYVYHYLRTGYVFGNPEFFRYNVASTLSFMRFSLALVLRLSQSFGYLHLWVATAGMLLAMFWPPLADGGIERKRISPRHQLQFLAILSAYLLVLSLIGGAVLARYMLPVVPLVIIVAVSTLRRRVRLWPVAVAIVAVTFVAALFWNPPYGFSPEDNLSYRDYIVLHQRAERFLEARYPTARVLTAWPASDELARPWLGYLDRPMKVVRIEDFAADEVLSAAEFRSNFEVALVFSTKYEPPRPLLERWGRWQQWKVQFFGFHRDLPPPVVANILGGHVVFSETKKGQWVAVIEITRSELQNAALRPQD